MYSVPNSVFVLVSLSVPDALQHDAQLDYYGRRLATASSDRTIRLFDVDGDNGYKLVETLRG